MQDHREVAMADGKDDQEIRYVRNQSYHAMNLKFATTDGIIVGHVVRIAPNELVFSTPQAITGETAPYSFKLLWKNRLMRRNVDIYSAAVKNHETWVKTSFNDFGTGDGGISWEQDPAKHRKVAKRISPVFSTKSIKAKEHVLQMYIDMFIKRMREIGGSKDGVELPKVSERMPLK
jgi:hypothetical protein